MTGAHIAMLVVACCVAYLVVICPLAVAVGKFIRRGSDQ